MKPKIEKIDDERTDSSTYAKHSNASDLFASPFRSNDDVLNNAIAQCVESINLLKHKKDNGPAFLGKSAKLDIDFTNIKNISLNENGITLKSVMAEVIKMFEGLPNWGHPLNMSNVCPQENLAAILSSMISQVFSPNILEGEYAWNTAKAELESAGILANLAKWNALKAGGIFTYGGSGCWLYHLKYALSRVFPGSRDFGIRVDGKVFCSEQAHYAMLNSTDWSGLGMNNIIKIRTVPDSNIMDIDHLETELKKCQQNNIPVISVVCTMATTDANSFDPVKKVRQLLNKYPNRKKYGKAFLYCDAVIGWSWLTFKDYNFKTNPLKFSLQTLKPIETNYNAVKDIFYADAFGVDFHKCFSPLTSSIFVYKNAKEFEKLLSRKDAAYLQKRSPYNPHDYSLEVSRSASGSMSGWATLKFLGATGFQSILGNILEKKVYLLNKLKDHAAIVCVNEDDKGWATLLRIYEEETNAITQYNCELRDIKSKSNLLRNNKMIEAIGELLWQWFREKKIIHKRFTPYLSITKGFRPTLYNLDGQDKKAVIFAIKIYPVNSFTTEADIDHAITCIKLARDFVSAKAIS